jgi:hypothetical protein
MSILNGKAGHVNETAKPGPKLAEKRKAAPV